MSVDCQERADSFEMPFHPVSSDTIAGCLLGAAVGDAVGLVCEGYSRRRQQAVFGAINGPRLLPGGRGMVSDDTEHAIMVAQALVVSSGEPSTFLKSLARQLRWWLCGLPAGTGKATLQACVRLCCGIPPQHSGLPSAGNGPAMRSALIGVCFGHDAPNLIALVAASTRITHTDPKAEVGAYAVALAAYCATLKPTPSPQQYLDELRSRLAGSENSAGDEMIELVERTVVAYENGQSCAEFADSIGLQRGISGYIYHTVPVALLAWFRHPQDMRAAVLELVHCGGDTDSTAAIAAAIIGAGCGRSGVPTDWLNSLWEWPRDVAWLEKLTERLAIVCHERTGQPLLPCSAPTLLLRNFCFLLIVLCHGFRRLVPPY